MREKHTKRDKEEKGRDRDYDAGQETRGCT